VPAPAERIGPRGVTWLGLGSNILLAAGKIGAGLAFASRAILADGVHSLTDLISDAAVLVGLARGDQPADAEHPYGHRRIHTLVAMFVGAMLLAAAGWIGYSAVLSLQDAPPPIRGPWPLVMALLTLPIKELLFHLTLGVARRRQNPGLRANAWHHRTDAFSSLAAAAGIAGAMFLGPGWARLDAVTAILLSAFLAVAAWRMIYESVAELIDSAPGSAHMDRLREITRQTPRVRDCHALRARTLAGRVDMDLHVLVDPELTVRESHDIATRVKRRLMETDPSVQQVIVHIEPFSAGEAAENPTLR
jgi:cation diffusion facilitator family transporter